MDRVGGAREAQLRLRDLHPGRIHPLQGHGQDRVQLRPPRADRR